MTWPDRLIILLVIAVILVTIPFLPFWVLYCSWRNRRLTRRFRAEHGPR